MPRRKYALTRIKAGDYLLPSNDRSVIWRIVRYTEDGSAAYDDGTKLVGEFWRLCKYVGRNNRIDPDAWDDSHEVTCLLKSRDAAIKEAMKYATEK